MLSERLTRPFVIEVPLLDDESVASLHTFLIDLITEFENVYFSQLHQHAMYVDELCREAQEKRANPPSCEHGEPDEALNDELPF